MSDGLITLELVARGVAIGALAACAVGIWKIASRKSFGLATALLCLAAVAHVLENSTALRTQLGPLAVAVNFISLGGTGFAWLFIVTLFEDRPIAPLTLAPAAVLIVLGLIGHASTGATRPFWLLHKLCETGVALHALSVIFRTWRDDLVEARSRIRVPFLAMVSIYVPLMVGIQVATSSGARLPLLDLINAGALATMSIAGAAIFLRGPLDLLAISRPAEAPPPDTADRIALENLNRVMDADQIWRREGLTIGALADATGQPEHRLRRLINSHLGFRNFAAFVNARRIEAAKRMLVDPGHSRTTVASIAFDLGFGSLGPFNRAFKQATGLTPTEFRRPRRDN